LRLLSKNQQKKDDQSDEEEPEKIDNSIQGVCDYLTAQNIKNKIKHPLYLLFKFSKCFKVYYNTKVFNSFLFFQTLEENIIWRLQLILFSVGSKVAGIRDSLQSTKAKGLEEKDFIFYIENPNDPNSFYVTKTISEYFRPIHHENMHFTLNPKTIPSNFVEVSVPNLEKAYESIYSFVSRFKGKGNIANLLNSNSFPTSENPQPIASMPFNQPMPNMEIKNMNLHYAPEHLLKPTPLMVKEPQFDFDEKKMIMESLIKQQQEEYAKRLLMQRQNQQTVITPSVVNPNMGNMGYQMPYMGNSGFKGININQLMQNQMMLQNLFHNYDPNANVMNANVMNANVMKNNAPYISLSDIINMNKGTQMRNDMNMGSNCN